MFRSTRLVFVSVVAACFPAASAGGAAPLMEVFAVSDAVRIFEDGRGNVDPPLAEIRLFGLRNETVSGQCVIRALEDLTDVTVSSGPLKQADSSSEIPRGNIRWNFVDGIFIERNTPKFHKGDLARDAPAWFPDCLSDACRCPVKKGMLKAVYWTIVIPRDAAPGRYRAEVTVTYGAARASLPMVLTVYPLVLPDQRHLMVTEWFSTGQFKEFHGIDPADEEQFFRMLRVYADNMAEHRQNVFRISMNLVQAARSAGGKLRFDFSLFDRWAQVFWDTGHMDRLETGFVAEFGEEQWSSREIRLSHSQVYPKKGGLLDSLRWEQMRDGIQDYECLWLLENKIAQIKATLPSRVAELIQPSRRSIEIASQVVRSYADCTRDPEVLYAARRQAIEEILALDESPRVILQTNPPEHSTLANSAAVDVHGWAEPGTKITINGYAVPVAADGLLMQDVSPSREGTIVVEAKNDKGWKLMVRKFHLQVAAEARKGKNP